MNERNQQQLMAAYEAILGVTVEMLAAARANDWDLLVSLEKNCRRLVDDLIASGPHQPLPPELQQRKVQIIQRILEHDAQIRNLTEPWMARLEQFLGSVHNEQKLVRAYAPERSR